MSYLLCFFLFLFFFVFFFDLSFLFSHRTFLASALNDYEDDSFLLLLSVSVKGPVISMSICLVIIIGQRQNIFFFQCVCVEIDSASVIIVPASKTFLHIMYGSMSK